MERKVFRFIAVQIARMTGFAEQEIEPETKLVDTELDSMDQFLLVMECERVFGVCLPTSLSNWPQTVDELKAHVLTAPKVAK